MTDRTTPRLTPAERAALIERYRDGHRVVLEALAGATDAELDAAPAAPDEWTARQVVHHLADSEMMSALRLRRLIADDHPVIEGYDEPRFARRLFYADRPDRAGPGRPGRGAGDVAPDPRAPARGPVGARGDPHRIGPLRGRGLAAHLRRARPRPRRPDPAGDLGRARGRRATVLLTGPVPRGAGRRAVGRVSPAPSLGSPCAGPPRRLRSGVRAPGHPGAFARESSPVVDTPDGPLLRFGIPR